MNVWTKSRCVTFLCFLMFRFQHVLPRTCWNHSNNAQDFDDLIADTDHMRGDIAGDAGGHSSKTGAGGEIESITAAPTYSEARAAARAERAKLSTVESSTDTEADEGAAPAGAGLRGRGPPLQIGHGAKLRTLCDGAGLCSPGLWAPRARPRVHHPRVVALRAAIHRCIARLDSDGKWADDLFDRLARGQVERDPFPSDALADLTDYAMTIYDADGEDGARPRGGDLPQTIRVRLLQAILRDSGDPDWEGMSQFATGIRLGVGVRMPRTPAVYARKRRWRIPQQSDPEAWKEPTISGAWRDNYRSAKNQRAEVRRQLEEHVSEGLAFKLHPAAAVARYPNLQVASLGAVVKEGESGEVKSVRLVLDGTHGVDLNTRIRQRDQDRCPTAADARRYQREQARYGRVRGLAVDFQGAHRLPAVHPADWHLQACRADDKADSEIYFYKFGTFGVSSIAYFWSRIGGAAVRACHYLADASAELWLLLMADDLKVEATGDRPHHHILALLMFLRILNFPFSWPKVQGGDTIRWIGYELNLPRLTLGITAGRAEHAVAWLRRIVRDRQVHVAELRSELGRLSFICGALEYERPFLAPLYSFRATCRTDAIRSLPRFVAVACQYLADRIFLRRSYPSAVVRRRAGTAPRVDARADGDAIGIGGWEPRNDSQGRPATSLSRWFMVTLSKTTAPWAYSKSGEPYRTIAALEAYATLIGLMSFQNGTQHHSDEIIALPCLTDNQGNESALRKLSSSKYPLSVIIMELAAQLEARQARLSLHWIPRESNAEADRLSNGDSRGFSPELRVPVDPSSLNFIVLPRLLEFGDGYAATVNANREGKSGA